jgi:hypothetical protein
MHLNLHSQLLKNPHTKVFNRGEAVMSTNTKLQNIAAAIVKVPQGIIYYISGAVTRIFSPTDDNYPVTGVQPFEGDPADKKHSEV